MGKFHSKDLVEVHQEKQAFQETDIFQIQILQRLY